MTFVQRRRFFSSVRLYSTKNNPIGYHYTSPTQKSTCIVQVQLSHLTLSSYLLSLTFLLYSNSGTCRIPPLTWSHGYITCIVKLSTLWHHWHGLENPRASLLIMNLCVICNTTDAKYCCPACNRRTCSLTCVRTHKTQFTCSGKRNRTEYVPIPDYTDRHFMSGEYRVL